MDYSETYDDRQLESDLAAVQRAVREWAISHDIWYDCGFKSFLEQVDGEPSQSDPVVCVQYFSSSFEIALYGDLEGEFSSLLRSRGFYYENAGFANLYYYPDEGPRSVAYARYFRWQWVCSLVEEDFADVHEELYGHFAARPDDLYRLGWREYEVLLSRIFRTQGFEVELGPGQDDGGVDIRLLQRDPIGDILTLVQAKKYQRKYKIGLETVQALTGAAFVEQAKGIVVTTSSYLPSARKFAARTSGRIDLRTSDDVAAWCRDAENGIIEDKSKLVSPQAVERLLLELKQKKDRRLLHTFWGHNATHNNFAVVLKETNHAALLMGLRNLKVTDDGYGQRGTEIPLLDATAIGSFGRETVWRAKRKVGDDGRVSFWDGNHLYDAWNGEPVGFDYYD